MAAIVIINNDNDNLLLKLQNFLFYFLIIGPSPLERFKLFDFSLIIEEYLLFFYY